MPTMSDTGLLMTVEDLILTAMGPDHQNKVDFKQLECLLMIFAQQLRCLDKEVNVCLESMGRRRSSVNETESKLNATESEALFSRKVRTRRIGSIDVVTASEFNILRNHVMKLKGLMGPIAMPTMPDNATLMSGIIGGVANLPDTMDAMQVKSRIVATEEMVLRMTKILETLAASGRLPKEVSDLIASAAAVIKSMPSFGKFGDDGLTHERSTDMHLSYLTEGVTQSELEKAVANLRAELKSIIDSSQTGASHAMEKAFLKSEEVRGKLGRTMNMADKLDGMKDLVENYASQLDGLEGGITKQVQDCKGEMDQLDKDLAKGLKEFKKALTNPETLAVKELTKNYLVLVSDLENITYEHSAEISKHNILNQELMRLMDAISVLQDQKSDRDEMLDALQDKADKTLLQGMVSSDFFEEVRQKIKEKFVATEHKFCKQDKTWKDAINELTATVGTKCTLVELWRYKEEAALRMQEMEERLRCLALAVGEPATALLTRELSNNAICGECGQKAKMWAKPVLFHKPPPSPRSPHGAGDQPEDPCLRFPLPVLPDNRKHFCHRYVGGSHTVLKSVVRQSAEHGEDLNTQSYTEIGPGGKSYYMSEGLQPCRQCSTIFEDSEECSNQGSKKQ